MVSFEDVDSVDVDFDDNTFTINRNSGKSYTYNIDQEFDLFQRMQEGDYGIPFFEVSREEGEISIDEEIRSLWKELEGL